MFLLLMCRPDQQEHPLHRSCLHQYWQLVGAVVPSFGLRPTLDQSIEVVCVCIIGEVSRTDIVRAPKLFAWPKGVWLGCSALLSTALKALGSWDLKGGGVVRCCGVWCGVPKALLPNGNGRDALHTGNAKQEGCVSERVLCVVCGAPVAEERAITLSDAGRLTCGIGEGRRSLTPLAALGTSCRSA